MRYNQVTKYDKELDKLIKDFRITWDCGPSDAKKGVSILNRIIQCVIKKSSLTVKETITLFYIENSDLVDLSISKIVSYLDQENRILYNKKRRF